MKSFSGIGRHIDRVDAEGITYVPGNADESRVNENLHWDSQGRAYSQEEWTNYVRDNSLSKRVNSRIEIGYKLTKTIRKDAVKALEYILTSDNRKMREIETSSDLFKDWIVSNREFIESIHGKENIVAFSLHRDEESAHIHAVVVPLTEGGRLTMEPYVGSPKKLITLQNAYADAMQKFGMIRGKAGSKQRHERPDKDKSIDRNKTFER